MDTSAALLELASVSLACRDHDTLLKAFASRVAGTVNSRAVLVWMADSDDGLTCHTYWNAPGEKLIPADGAIGNGLLSEVLESGEARRLSSRDLKKVDLSHLEETSQARVKSALYAPLPGAQGPKGVVEILVKQTGDFTEEDARFAEEASRLAGQALTNLEAIEEERRTQLATLERLTGLYDLGRTFTSTLELKELLPVVAEKIRDLLGAAACNLWLMDSGSQELYLAQRAGEDPTVEDDARVSSTEGLLGEIAQQVSPKLIEDPSGDEALTERRAAAKDFEMHCWMATPLRKDDEVIGVVELINKNDGTSFDEDELFLLSSISEQAAIALHNANLLESERKVRVLDALLKISQEVTSTLDLDHVLTTVVHQAATIVPFDKCVIGFFDRGRFVLGAVSGESEVPNTREMTALRERLEWVADQREIVSGDQYSDGWRFEPEAARAQLHSFLEPNRYSGFYALPLRDEQGPLGAIALVSGDADFLTATHKETLAILASQTSVAIRNAQLYQQMPLANIFQPLAKRKEKLLAAVPKARRRLYAERVGIAVVALILIPWPIRVGADATVVPVERRNISAVEGGVVKHVFVHEGDSVQPGQLLARLDASDDEVKLAQAQAALAQSRHDLAEAEFHNDVSAAGQAKNRADLYAIEVQLTQNRISEAELRAPIAGLVVTPKIEERTGTMVRAGEAFCEVVAMDRMAAEMSVPETDLGLVQSGRNAALKLNAYPTETFRGQVQRIGTETKSDSGQQYFLVRAVFQNLHGLARDGMVGRARISASGGWFGSGWYPVGYALFRDPFRWFWQEAWSWIP